MTQKVYSVDEGSDPRVRESIKTAIARIGGERIDTDFKDGSEAYHFSALRVTAVYDGLRRIHIAGGSEALIRRAESELEKMDGLKLRQID